MQLFYFIFILYKITYKKSEKATMEPGLLR